ncbi:hypothetical protein SAMN05444722_0715 [Rhodovulum sp. ES.010]|uniref:hypothetical protein n=1 Tax=Rhodovulum sp. ES.010 TaxID=1882821 RepID=UPI0009269C92|nr:hypothetical protein [Rhodovulum sp. ES.010]SIO17772.1 hypothetical protein SAMN05444722_0715 [Rhodovulum sp. ES.010]
MRLLVVALAGWSVTLSAPAAAQEGPEWDLQRCIWRCLSAFGPNTNPAYHACVDERCAGEPAAAAGSTPASAWTAGRVNDGSGAYAGVTSADTGHAFYFACGPGGRSLVVLNGPEGPPATLQLVIDGRAHALFFHGNDLQHVAELPPGSEILAELAQGTSLEILKEGGGSLGRFSLVEAGAAISRAQALCR